jgi:outer membrane protein OmpA-like peptidoglycan-associated protein
VGANDERFSQNAGWLEDGYCGSLLAGVYANSADMVPARTAGNVEQDSGNDWHLFDNHWSWSQVVQKNTRGGKMNWIFYHVSLKAIAVVALSVILSILGGCSKKTTKIEIAPDEPKMEMKQTAQPAKQEYKQQRFAPAPKPEAVTVYFAFDSDNLQPEEAIRLDPLLSSACKLKIIGHACTFGTNEYNLGLGLARAEMVRRYLGRGETVSYGEELCKAECATVDEDECQQCRRVEVVPQ